MTEANERARVAGQIGGTLLELQQQARQAGFGILAHLFQMARLEADNAACEN